MPKRSAFTSIPRELASLERPSRADLHVHSTASDGAWSAATIVELARQSRLAAIAITDHDTLGAIGEARSAAGKELEIVPGVEISCTFGGREVHLLGYFVRLDSAELNGALERLRIARRERFHDFVGALAGNGTVLPEEVVAQVAAASDSLGRRHVAGLLVQSGMARSHHEAFRRHLGPVQHAVRPKLLLPVEEAIRLVERAGGVASLAHPSPRLTDEDFAALTRLGLKALEAEYPWGRRSRAARLRELAARFGLEVSGGSDCHGPGPAGRALGARGIPMNELDRLRELCRRSDCCAFQD